MKAKLPNKPSALITIALEDLEKCERSKKYVVDMSVWHTPSAYDPVCYVCLAGAVMAGTLGAPREEVVGPGAWGDATMYKLSALNALRKGDINSALINLGCDLQKGLPNWVQVAPYENSPAQFKRDMRSLAKLLKKHNL